MRVPDKPAEGVQRREEVPSGKPWEDLAGRIIPRITYHSVTVPCEENTNSLRRRPALTLFLVTGAAEHGEARIFWKARIGHRELAEEENGFAVRCDAASMQACGTQ